MPMTDREIARVIHEANRAVQQVNEEPVGPTFDEAPEWMVESILNGIEASRRGLGPEEMHDNWYRERTDDGWVYGEVKDEDAKTHPCLVDYDELPEGQRVKDSLFLAIVDVLS